VNICSIESSTGSGYMYTAVRTQGAWWGQLFGYMELGIGSWLGMGRYEQLFSYFNQVRCGSLLIHTVHGVRYCSCVWIIGVRYGQLFEYMEYDMVSCLDLSKVVWAAVWIHVVWYGQLVEYRERGLNVWLGVARVLMASWLCTQHGI
jgi:hypothetical protein